MTFSFRNPRRTSFAPTPRRNNTSPYVRGGPARRPAPATGDSDAALSDMARAMGGTRGWRGANSAAATGPDQMIENARRSRATEAPTAELPVDAGAERDPASYRIAKAIQNRASALKGSLISGVSRVASAVDGAATRAAFSFVRKPTTPTATAPAPVAPKAAAPASAAPAAAKIDAEVAKRGVTSGAANTAAMNARVDATAAAPASPSPRATATKARPIPKSSRVAPEPAPATPDSPASAPAPAATYTPAPTPAVITDAPPATAAAQQSLQNVIARATGVQTPFVGKPILDNLPVIPPVPADTVTPIASKVLASASNTAPSTPAPAAPNAGATPAQLSAQTTAQHTHQSKGGFLGAWSQALQPQQQSGPTLWDRVNDWQAQHQGQPSQDLVNQLAGMAKAGMATGGVIGAIAPTAAITLGALGAGMGASDQFGEAGAVVSGLGALAGGSVGSEVAAGLGGLIPGARGNGGVQLARIAGALLGGGLGAGAGGAVNSAAQSAVDRADSGRGGVIASIGEALDALGYNGTRDAELAEINRQMNSPAMQILMKEQQARSAKERADRVTEIYLSSLMG